MPPRPETGKRQALFKSGGKCMRPRAHPSLQQTLPHGLCSACLWACNKLHRKLSCKISIGFTVQISLSDNGVSEAFWWHGRAEIEKEIQTAKMKTHQIIRATDMQSAQEANSFSLEPAVAATNAVPSVKPFPFNQ